MADPVDVEPTNLTTAACLGRPDGTDATRDREEMSASSDGPSTAVVSNSSVVDVEVLAQPEQDPRIEAAYQAGYDSMRYDVHVWFDALRIAIPKILAAADALQRDLPEPSRRTLYNLKQTGEYVRDYESERLLDSMSDDSSNS